MDKEVLREIIIRDLGLQPHHFTTPDLNQIYNFLNGRILKSIRKISSKKTSPFGINTIKDELNDKIRRNLELTFTNGETADISYQISLDSLVNWEILTGKIPIIIPKSPFIIENTSSIGTSNPSESKKEKWKESTIESDNRFTSRMD